MIEKDFLLLFLYCSSIFLSGYFVIGLFLKEIVKKHDIFITFSLSWLVGSYFSIVVLYILAFVNKLDVITPQNFSIYVLFLAMAAIGLSIKNRKLVVPISVKNLIAFLLIIIFFIPLIKDSLFSYLIGWDAIAIWMLKAKVFFYDAGFWNNQFLSDTTILTYSNKPYPVGLPLLVAGYYHLIGSVNDQVSQFILLIFYLTIPLLLYGAFRKFLHTFSHLFTLMLTLTVSVLPNFLIYAHNGYVDMALGSVFLAGTVLYIFFLEEKESILRFKYIYILLVIGALGATIKNEGYTFWGMLMILIVGQLYFQRKSMSVKRTHIVQSGALFIVTLIPVLMWEYVKKMYDAPSSYYFADAGLNTQTIVRLKAVIFQFMDETISVTKYGILLFPFVLIFVLQLTLLISKRKTQSLLPAILVMSQLAFYSAVFLVASVPIDWQVTALDRLMLHVIPSFFIVVVYLVKPTVEIIKKDKLDI